MTFKGIFVDDDLEQQAIYAELLSIDEFEFSTQVLPTGMSQLTNDLLAAEPDIIVMDYRLDGTRPDGWDNNFKAGGVAQVLRDRFVDNPESDVPIVLLSIERNIQQLFAPDRTSHDLFDLWFIKEELHLGSGSRHLEILTKLKALICGYRTIRQYSTGADTQTLSQNLLNLSAEEYGEINTDGLKFALVNADGIAERTHIISRQIYQNVIKQSGLLLSEKGLIARLGVAANNFSEISVAAGFDQFSYKGILASGWPRFWRHRYDRWEAKNFEVLLGSMTGEERAEKISQVFGLNVEPAISKWTGRSDEFFSVACKVCGCPTELRHSVAIFEPKLLPFMERGKVCFDCVEQEVGMHSKRIRVAEADEAIVADIRNERIRRPEITNK